jgi:hypothetical protein
MRTTMMSSFMLGTKSVLPFVLPVVALALGCDASSGPDQRSHEAAATKAGSSPLVVNPSYASSPSSEAFVNVPIPGFHHSFAKSRFRFGASPPIETDDGATKRYIGTEGVFMELTNGFATGVPNAGAPSTVARPLTTDSKAPALTYWRTFSKLGFR